MWLLTLSCCDWHDEKLRPSSFGGGTSDRIWTTCLSGSCHGNSEFIDAVAQTLLLSMVILLHLDRHLEALLHHHLICRGRVRAAVSVKRRTSVCLTALPSSGGIEPGHSSRLQQCRSNTIMLNCPCSDWAEKQWLCGTEGSCLLWKHPN